MMDRRDFLSAAALAFLGTRSTHLEGAPAWTASDAPRPTPAAPGRFELLEVSGSYREIGYQVGQAFRRQIRTLLARRRRWHEGLLARRATDSGRRLSDHLEQLTARHFPQYLEELHGIAEGAGIAFETLWVMTLRSELGVVDPSPSGCSTVVVQDDRKLWLAHNEDFSDAYRDLMFVLRVKPPSGVRFLCLTYPGIISGNGPALNSEGLAQTTNYIGSLTSEVGIPRYILGRAILEARDLDEAVGLATRDGRAYPYHHNLVSLRERRIVSVETTPRSARVHAPEGFYVHTNHLVFEETRRSWRENESYRASSSLPRHTVLSARVSALDPKSVAAGDVTSMLSSHAGAPYSPCRHPRDGVTGRTVATAFVDAEEGRFRLYKGNPCQAVAGGRFADYEV